MTIQFHQVTQQIQYRKHPHLWTAIENERPSFRGATRSDRPLLRLTLLAGCAPALSLAPLSDSAVIATLTTLQHLWPSVDLGDVSQAQCLGFPRLESIIIFTISEIYSHLFISHLDHRSAI